MSFERFIQYIKQGEPVSPGTPNRAMRQIDQNAKYLWDVIQAAGIGSTVYARERTIESGAKIGMPVYYNPTTQQFERGLANVETDGATGQIMTSQSTQIWGIVAIKHNATLADLLLYGLADIDISEALGNVGGDVAAGLYHLSNQTPGYLTSSRPPVSVPVLRSDGNGNVFVNPTFMDFLDNHRHYKFELETSPAGTHTQPAEGEVHVIASADDSLPGWLPADHAVFDGKAPVNAKFGYNLKEEGLLNDLWPPLPITSYDLEFQRVSIYEPNPRQIMPLANSVLDDLVIVDRNGIWWMSDCYDEVPWPTNLETNVSQSESATVADCPRDVVHRMILWFTKVNFSTEASVVTSLRSVDSRVKIYCRDTTKVGATGDLDIDLDLQLTLGDDDRRGYLVFKELEGNKIHLGPVCEGIYATSSNVLLTSELQTRLIPGDNESALVHHGLTSLGVLTEPTRELSSSLVRLDGATEEFDPVLYLGLPDDTQTSFITKFDVPADVPVNSQFAYRARILGRAAGNTPQLTVEYVLVSRPVAGLTTPLSVSSVWMALAIDTVATLTAANQAVEATSNAFTVTPGDIVYIRVIRDPEDVGDGYSGELGIMQQTGVLTSSGS